MSMIASIIVVALIAVIVNQHDRSLSRKFPRDRRLVVATVRSALLPSPAHARMGLSALCARPCRSRRWQRAKDLKALDTRRKQWTSVGLGLAAQAKLVLFAARTENWPKARAPRTHFSFGTRTNLEGARV